MKIAAACYPIERIEGYFGLVEKYRAWVGEAAGAGAELVVFPEYGAAELAGIAGLDAAAAGDDPEPSMVAISARLPAYWTMCAELARRYRVYLLSGSGPFRTDRAWVNRAVFFGPDGGRVICDKQIMTPWERDPLGLSPGEPLRVIETPLGRIGVLICYDAEFPLLARALVEAGAELILVPSWTEAEDGYNRVRIGAMARALEGQCVTVQAPTQGAAPWSWFADENAGAAGIFGPPDTGFPPTGVIAEGEMNRPGWVMAEVDLAALDRVRGAGNVLTRAHWGESPARAGQVQTVALA